LLRIEDMMKTAIAANVVLAAAATWLMASLNHSLAPTSLNPTVGVLVCSLVVWFVLGAFVTILPAALASK
jgi:hypothetical protein